MIYKTYFYANCTVIYPVIRIYNILFDNTYEMQKICIYQLSQIKNILDDIDIVYRMEHNAGDDDESSISYVGQRAYTGDRWLYLNENQFSIRAFK